MDKLTNLLQTADRKKLIALVFLTGILCIGLYTILLNNMQSSTTPRAQTPDNFTCPYNYKMYLPKEAATNPYVVCGMTLGEEQDPKEIVPISKKLVHLDQLVIQDHDDFEIPPQIGDLKSLHLLKIVDNDGAFTIPPEIGYLTNLSEIILSNNQELESLPLSVAKLKNVTSVLIRYNPHLQIPDSLVSLPKLHALVVIGQTSKAIPFKVYQLMQLEQLSYSNDKLETISPDIDTMKTLKIINLANNSLTSFPSITNLVQLERLDLSKNKLTNLPQGIEKLQKLQSLYAPDNAITDDSVKNIYQIQNIVSIDLGDNELRHVPQNLSRLKKLQYLRLSGNQIDESEVAKLKEEMPQTTILY